MNFHHTLSTQNIVIIEPQNLSTFQPLTQLKPLSLLQWAGGSLFDALSAQFPEMSIHIWGNDDFKSIAMERHKVQFYNHKISGSTLFISSQFFPSFVTELFDLFEIEKESIFQSNHQFSFAFFENPPVQHEHFYLSSKAQKLVNCPQYLRNILCEISPPPLLICTTI